MTMRNVRLAAGYGHQNRVREEHVSIICESGSLYLGNVTPSSEATSKKCFEYLTVARSVDLDSVEVVGCHETIVNTERIGGVIQQLQGHDLCSNFTKCPLLSLPLSHTGGGKIRIASYRNFSRCVRRNALLYIN